MGRILAAFALLVLTACSRSHDTVAATKFVEYAETIPPIQAPAGIKDPTAESYYPIPPIAATQPVGSKPSLIPPGSQLTVHKNVPLPGPQ